MFCNALARLIRFATPKRQPRSKLLLHLRRTFIFIYGNNSYSTNIHVMFNYLNSANFIIFGVCLFKSQQIWAIKRSVPFIFTSKSSPHLRNDSSEREEKKNKSFTFLTRRLRYILSILKNIQVENLLNFFTPRNQCWACKWSSQRELRLWPCSASLNFLVSRMALLRSIDA